MVSMWWLFSQEMGRTRSTSNIVENFVNWNEPMESNEEITPTAGDAHVLRGKKRKQSKRGTSERGGLERELRGTAVHEPRNAGLGTQSLLDGRDRTLSRGGAQSESVNPPPKFVPPRRVPSTRSAAAVTRSAAAITRSPLSDQVQDHRSSPESSALNKSPEQREVSIRHQEKSRSVQVDGTSSPQITTAPQGKKYCSNIFYLKHVMYSNSYYQIGIMSY